MTIRIKKEKLKRLLESRFGSEENPWISERETEQAGFRVAQDNGELVADVRFRCLSKIYANNLRGRPVDGFEFLLQNMDTTQKERIVIHGMVDAERRKYRIFTDPEMDELLGVLRYPVEDPRNRPKPRTARLKKLVSESFGSGENPWISAVEVEQTILEVARRGGVPVAELLSTYERRGRLNKERGDPIEGFDVLLQNMDRTETKMGLVHGVTDSHQRNYHLFTDEGVDELFGILKFPIKEAK